MLRLLVLIAILSTGFLLAPTASAKEDLVPIPDALNGCVDFRENACGDSDGDGYLNWFEWIVGSDANNSGSTPEYGLFDEQSHSNTCGDKIDNDLDGRTDNGDAGCRLNCKDFGPNDRCTDSDRDGWLNYVEDLYGSDPNNPLSTPESFAVGGTCNDGIDNDLDGDIDQDDVSCGGEIGDCIDFDSDTPCDPF